MLSAHLLSVVDMLTHDFVVLPREALNVVTNILGTVGGRTKLTLRAVATPSTSGKTAPAKRTASRATAEVKTEAAAEETTESKPRASRSKAVDAAPAVATGVVIATVHFQGEEYVQLRNDGETAVDLGGWTLRDKNDDKQSMTFPEGTELKPGSTVKIFTEPGHKLSFNSKSSIWNDKGDVAVLINSEGDEVSEFAYGSYAAEGDTEGSES
jgi:hypothetical protein